MQYKKLKQTNKREFTNIPQIGSNVKHSTHYSTIQNQSANRELKLLHKNPPRKFFSIKNTPPHDISGVIAKPLKSSPHKQKPLQKNDNEEEIQNCFSQIDEVFKSLSDHLLSSDFQDLFQSIHIPENLIPSS